MITKQDDLLGTLIHDVAHLLRHEIDDRLRPFNLTRAKWLALGIIQRNPDLSQSELATRLELGAASVGRLVDRLVQRGFVNRAQDPNDRRSYTLQITQDAADVLAQLDGVPDHLERTMLDGLSEKEIDSLSNSLLKIKEKLKLSVASLAAFLPILASDASKSLLAVTEYGIII
ncbi:MarR family winged helix-turn-helix transcriptional regulator [Litorimonas cladophorae]|nr:MarR family transcriptional regulator [Litorimonas cladophorae]